MNLMMDQIFKNSIYKYLIQTQSLFGDVLYTEKENTNDSFCKSGNVNSDLVFIKNFSSIKEQKTIFLNILKALDLSIDQILIIELIDSRFKTDKNLKYLLNKLNSKFIITLGLDISQFLLNTKDSLELLRNKNNIFLNSKLIPTYSLDDIENNPDLKKYVWNDLRKILV